jgi:uncharacterized protein (DUF1786 family)
MSGPRIAAIDVGTGTQDILIFEAGTVIENSVQLVMPSPTVLPAQAKALMSRCRSVPMTGRWWLRAVLDRLVSRRVMLNGSCGPSCSILFDPTSTSFPTSC